MSELTHNLTFEPVSEPISEHPPEAVAKPPHWTFGTRLAFRFAFCYFILYALCCGNTTIWQALLPVIGVYLASWLHWPFIHAALWLGQHVFHLTGVAATLHGGGSNDRAIDWIALGVMFVMAIVATLAWTALDRHRKAYPTLFGWFRFIIRLALGVALFGYGMYKVFPIQMPPPSLAVLNEPLGNTSPMTLLWTLIGVNPGYEMVCGAAEVIAGLLILFRRTALLGALVTAFITTNIVLYNFFFDVPVKIFGTQLLLMSLAVIVPDVRSLFRYFWLHEPAAPSGSWVPPSTRAWFRRSIDFVEVWILVIVCVALPISIGVPYVRQIKSLKNPSPLIGQWHLTSATKPYRTGDGLPMTDIFLEPNGRASVRSSDGVLWVGGVQIDDKKHTLQLFSIGHDGAPVYAMVQPDPSHLVLTPAGKNAGNDGVLTLTRVPLPAHYLLEERGFHFINEWGLER